MGRGWVFQEWLLSRRLLAYTQSGLFFECRTESPSGISREQIENSTHTMGLKKELTGNPRDIYELWYRLVETYSGRSLSFPDKDRILAISGVASVFREILKKRQTPQNLQYVSGLWLMDSHLGLL